MNTESFQKALGAKIELQINWNLIFFFLMLTLKWHLLNILLEYYYMYVLTLTLLDLTKSYKDYLQKTQHVVLRNRPTLPIGTERLACLNSPRGVQLVTLA